MECMNLIEELRSMVSVMKPRSALSPRGDHCFGHAPELNEVTPTTAGVQESAASSMLELTDLCQNLRAVTQQFETVCSQVQGAHGVLDGIRCQLESARTDLQDAGLHVRELSRLSLSERDSLHAIWRESMGELQTSIRHHFETVLATQLSAREDTKMSTSRSELRMPETEEDNSPRRLTSTQMGQGSCHIRPHLEKYFLEREKTLGKPPLYKPKGDDACVPNVPGRLTCAGESTCFGTNETGPSHELSQSSNELAWACFSREKPP